MNYYIIDEVQLQVIKAVSRRLYSENRMTGDTMRDFAQALDNIDTSCRQLPAYPGGLPWYPPCD